MVNFNPYITFDDKCEEALHFYEKCFNGEIVFIQYFEDGIGEKIALSGNRKVIHSEFRAGAIHFMACDKFPGQTIHAGTNITFYISFTNAHEQNEAFDNLSEKGIVHMPVESTFWGSRLGILTDQFGIHWMLVLNYE